MAQAEKRRREGERKRTEAALGRLDEGEWGWCVGCGEAIVEGILHHDSSIATCVKCAAKD